MTEQTGNNKPNEAEGLAFPLSGNEKLIDSVRDWPTITRMSHSTQLEKLVELRDALEAAEEALTPTEDEREDMIAFLLRDHNFEESPWGRTYTDAEIANALRRSEVPEPSAEPKHDESCAEWCNHCQACGEGIRYGSRCREHYQNQPQAEPSDAQLLAALTAYEAKAREQGSFPAMATPLNLTWFSDASADRMRAALRAAGVGGVR